MESIKNAIRAIFLIGAISRNEGNEKVDVYRFLERYDITKQDVEDALRVLKAEWEVM